MVNRTVINQVIRVVDILVIRTRTMISRSHSHDYLPIKPTYLLYMIFVIIFDVKMEGCFTGWRWFYIDACDIVYDRDRRLAIIKWDKKADRESMILDDRRLLPYMNRHLTKLLREFGYFTLHSRLQACCCIWSDCDKSHCQLLRRPIVWSIQML